MTMDWTTIRGGNAATYDNGRQQDNYNNYNRSSVISLSSDGKTAVSISNNNNDECTDVIKGSVPADDTIKDDDSDDGNGSDAEGIWSADIEQSFLEALAIYPPCGRRKIILSDEGKMYGRNELIARYIKLRTGKTRTRKQVSSHIQVLARRKSKEIQSHIKDQTSRERVLQSLASMSSSQIVSATSLHHRNNSNRPAASAAATVRQAPSSTPLASSRYASTANQVLQYCASAPDAVTQQPVSQFWSGMDQRIQEVKLGSQYPVQTGFETDTQVTSIGPAAAAAAATWQRKGIIAPQLHLVDFTSFVALANHSDKLSSRHNLVQLTNCRNNGCMGQTSETIDIQQVQDKFPDTSDGLKDLFAQGPQEAFFLVKFWADLITPLHEETGAFYGVTYQFESSSNMTLSVSTKVCSFGKQVIEKIETECASCCDYGRFVYCINRSPMCEYMASFINRLRQLPESYMMNSVLENFTVLQTIRNHDTQQLLLCIAYTFEVSVGDRTAECNVYRIVHHQ